MMQPTLESVSWQVLSFLMAQKPAIVIAFINQWMQVCKEAHNLKGKEEGDLQARRTSESMVVVHLSPTCSCRTGMHAKQLLLPRHWWSRRNHFLRLRRQLKHLRRACDRRRQKTTRLRLDWRADPPMLSGCPSQGRILR